MPLISTAGSLSSRGFGEFRRAAASFFPYYILTSSVTSDVLYKSTSLSGAFTNIGSRTIGSYSTTRRMGIVFARGNLVAAPSGITLDGGGTIGATYPGINQIQIFGAGLNGSFAYNPTTNVFAVPTDQRIDSKSGTYYPGICYYNASTGAAIGAAYSSSGFVPTNVDGIRQIIYSPALDRYYVFTRSGSGGLQMYHAFSAETGVFILSSGVLADDSCKFVVAPNGYPRVMQTNTLYEYTSQNLTSPTNLGSVSSPTGASSSQRFAFTYLPVNQKYAVIWRDGGSLFFSSSNAATPTTFTVVSFVPPFSMNNAFVGTIFEDTDGKIYASYFIQYQSGKDTARDSVSFVSSDGGASFSFYGFYMAFAKNLL